MTNELYLKTAFCCMACDGDIAHEEVDLIRSYVRESSLFEGLEVERLLNEYIEKINVQGIAFLNSFIRELNNEEMLPEQELEIVRISIKMIEADNEILYSEVKFFKRIRACLSITDEEILKYMPDKEDYLLPDISQSEYEFVLENNFESINLSLVGNE